jgi:hypothetical protein
MKKPSQRNDVAPLVIGLVAALLTGTFIKKVLIPTIGGATVQAQVFSLDAAVVVVLLAAFVLEETMETIQTLLRLKSGKHVRLGLQFQDVALIVGALVISSLLYAAIIRSGVAT